VTNADLDEAHGYVFEVPVEGAASALPVRKAGRFAHEAIAVDPVEGVAYLTEDDFGFPSGFFKYVPPVHPLDAGELVDGGELFMLAVAGEPNAPLGDRQRLRATFKTVWVPIDDPDPDFPRLPDDTPTTTNDDAIHYVAGQGWAQGAAFFSRLEGAVFDGNVVYFCSTQGGGDPEDPDISTSRPAGYGMGSGQIWAYHCRSGSLQLLYQAPDRDTLDFPDNITASPRGTHVMCEDNVEDNYLRAVAGRPAVGSGAQPAPEPDQRRIRWLHVLSGRKDALRQHPGIQRHDLRHLGTVGAGGRLSTAAGGRCHPWSDRPGALRSLRLSCWHTPSSRT
jgi:uncharacterized protein